MILQYVILLLHRTVLYDKVCHKQKQDKEVSTKEVEEPDIFLVLRLNWKNFLNPENIFFECELSFKQPFIDSGFIDLTLTKIPWQLTSCLKVFLRVLREWCCFIFLFLVEILPVMGIVL